MRNLFLSFLIAAFALPLWALDRDDFTNGTYDGAIVYAEYFIDADPGFGMGTAIPVPNGSTANLAANLSVPTDDLTTGPHELFVRVQNSSGDWSQVANQLFRISPLLRLSPPEIVAAEYFLDNDPGVGAGTAIAVEPGPAVTTSANIAIPEGTRVLYFRAQDDQGWWSQPVPHMVRTFAPPLPDALAWDLVRDDTVLASGQQSISPATPDFTTTLVTDPLPVDLSPGPAQLRVNTVFAGAFRAPAQAVTLEIVDITLDSDGDGLPDRYETGSGTFVSNTDTGTDPNVPDSDGDGLRDGDEVSLLTDPNVDHSALLAFFAERVGEVSVKPMIHRGPDGNFFLSVRLESGRTLGDFQHSVLSSGDVSLSGGDLILRIPQADGDTYFYRIRAGSSID